MVAKRVLAALVPSVAPFSVHRLQSQFRYPSVKEAIVNSGRVVI